MKALTTTLVALLAVAAVSNIAHADPLPNRDKIKFSQLPMNQTQVVGQVYWGHDELSTAYAPVGAAPTTYRGNFMADDFGDTLSTPVVHVKWWGSYLNNSEQYGKVSKFLIAFEPDVAMPNPLGFSYPDPNVPAFSQIVTAGAITQQSGTFTETFLSPGGPPLGEHLYQYNAELSLPFAQQPNTVYWLKIVALVDTAVGVNPADPNAQIPRWGWHNRDYTQKDTFAAIPPLVSPGENQQGNAALSPIWHFQDDSVSGQLDVNTFINTTGVQQVGSVNQFLTSFQPQLYKDNIDGPTGISQYSKDLAFELYTTQVTPEPCSVALLGVALIGLAAGRRRNRSN